MSTHILCRPNLSKFSRTIEIHTGRLTTGGNQRLKLRTLARTVAVLACIALGALQLSAQTVSPQNPIIIVGTTQLFTASNVLGVQLSSSFAHSCAVMSSGQVECWGYGGDGELGNGSAISGGPVVVTGLTGATLTATGGFHSCAVTNAIVKCWGLNDSGQLGNGTTSNSNVPVAVSGLSHVIGIASGGTQGNIFGAESSCALIADGTVQCWGSNSNGQLGNGSTNSSTAPVAVAQLTGVKSIAGGYFHYCAVLSDATVKCWGSNSNGQLGNGSTTDSSTPVSVLGLGNVRAISVGFVGSCALLTDGTVRCWGANGSGQLGNGSLADSSTPVASNVSGAIAIATSGIHACAVISDGTLKCWGNNYNGALGNGTSGYEGGPSFSTTPVSTLNLSSATAVSAGLNQTCALLNDGTAKCWGYNGDGELGNSFSNYQIDIPAITPITSAAMWTSSNPAAATIDPSSGLATGVGAGNTTITVQFGIVSGLTTLTVVPDNDSQYSQLNGGNAFAGNQTVSGGVTAANFSGSGAGLTNLPAANLTGIISDGNLPADVPRLALANNFTNSQSVNTLAYYGLQANGGTYGVWASGANTGVQGTGNALGVYGNSNGSGGTGVYGVASSYGVQGRGGAVGVFGTTTNGIAGAFNATAGGKILSGQINGSEVFSVDSNGAVTIGGGTAITEHLSTTFNPNFPALKPSTCTIANFVLTGASDGDTLALGVPNARTTGGGTIFYSAWVNAANNITIQACNVSAIPQKTAGSGAIRVDIWKH